MTSLRSLHPAIPASAAPRWLAAGLWLLAGLSASYWGLRVWGDAELVSVPAPAAESVAADPQALAGRDHDCCKRGEGRGGADHRGFRLGTGRAFGNPLCACPIIRHTPQMTTLPSPPALKPIAIGPVTVAEPVVLAPMTGVTDMPFRTLVRRYGSGLNVTEMVASEAAIRSAMDRSCVDLAMDIHGDEAIAAVFLAGFEGIPSLKAEQLEGFQRYKVILDRRTPDFQTRRGYPVAQPGRGNVTMATSQIAERYGAVAMTLEMPFKDNDDLPDPDQGWSPERSKLLAHDCLAVLAEMVAG